MATKKKTAKKKASKKKTTAKENEIKVSGRPTDFTPDLGDKICDRLVDGLTLREIEALPDMPRKSTILRWVVKGEQAGAPEDLSTFSDQYARALEAKYEELREDIENAHERALMPVLVDGVPILDDKGKPIMSVTKESIALAKLETDNKKWLLSKIRRKRYGDKVEVSGDQDNPVQTVKTVKAPELISAVEKIVGKL